MRDCLMSAVPALTMLLGAHAVAEPVWRMFAPAGKVEGRADTDYLLAEDNGPWMVMAATFSGEGAENQARELVLELRKDFNLQAFHHSMTFDHASDERLGRGIDRYGAPLRMRYKSGESSQEYAVMVGNFPAIDDPVAQKQLDDIKKLRPKSLSLSFDETAQNLAAEREYLTRLKGGHGAPPMSKAFLTRNPLLPEEYFKPKGVDPEVAKMNTGLEFSLLECPERYTVKIATFKGKTVLQGAFGSEKAAKKAENETPALVEAAHNAHRAAVFLRAKGWEAYEFHDRTESYVTVGSFEKVANQIPGGGVKATREVELILQTFGAAYKTPTALNVNEDIPMVDRMRAQEVVRQFNNRFSNSHGQIAGGLQPKYIQYAEDGFIALDVNPEVIEAPKRSVTSAYAWRR